MLNLQFAETMELTEAELQDVRGGNTVVNPGGGIVVGWGGLGTPWSITNFWKKYFNDKPESDSDRRRY